MTEGGLMLSNSNILELWRYVNQGSDFPWPRSQKSKERLAQSISLLISDDAAVSALSVLDKNAFNLKIRELISPKLREGKSDQSTHIANWIVRDWGGINNGNGAISGWVDQLRNFEHENIDEFVKEMGVNRVSSWSKILAFSDPVNHAIYDARTAVALNCALEHLGVDCRFSMPVSRNRTMIAVRSMLLPQIRGNERGYTAYIDLLKAISKTCDLGDNILKVEMTLFANAPLIAERFVQARQEG